MRMRALRALSCHLPLLCRGTNDEKKKDADAKPKPASLITLVIPILVWYYVQFSLFLSSQFRFSSITDRILLILGTVCAILHGSSFPVVMLIFGQLTDAFINQAITVGIVDPDTADATSACLTLLYPHLDNSSDLMEALSQTIYNTSGSVDCDAQFNIENITTTLDDIIPMCFGDGRKCLSNSAFIDVIEMQCYIFVGIAVAVLLLSGLQVLFFQLVAERQVHLIRQRFYRAILRQDIGWFDANPSGELSSRLSE